jgi:hypothetical protein
MAAWKLRLFKNTTLTPLCRLKRIIYQGAGNQPEFWAHPALTRNGHPQAQQYDPASENVE